MRHELSVLVLLLAGVPDSAGGLPAARHPTSTVRQIPVAIALKSGKDRMSGGESTTMQLVVKRNGNTQELVFRLENGNPALVRMPVSEIRLAPSESAASFEVFTAATPIRTSVTVKAALQPADQVQVLKVIELVPATLKGVTLSQPTLNGTFGSRITCRVELNANAPPGGIELYLDWRFFSSTKNGVMRLNGPSPRVAAGSREVVFEIPYSDLYIGDQRAASDPNAYGNTHFDDHPRKVELIAALEPQSGRAWVAIPGIAAKVSFDAIPLRVASASVQPASVTGGAEALGTFTLSFPPGNGERVYLGPGTASSSQRAWIRLLGSSCQAGVSGVLEMPLSAGVTTYTFKVCTGTVTTVTTATLHVSTRSADSPTPLTVRP